jgi:hypothetical protein
LRIPNPAPAQHATEAAINGSRAVGDLDGARHGDAATAECDIAGEVDRMGCVVRAENELGLRWDEVWCRSR